MDAMTAPASLAETLAARGLTVARRDDGTLSVTNPLHPLVGETVTDRGGRYLTDYGYEIGAHGDETGTAERVAHLLGLPRSTPTRSHPLKGSAMTDSTPDAARRHIRRSELHAAAAGAAASPLQWATDSGASVIATLAAWDRGELADMATGHAWDAVRLPRSLGWRTIERMQQAGTPVGPAQHTPDGVEVLVPVGSAAGWRLPDCEVLTDGAPLRVPHPAVVAPITQYAHSWIVSPQDGGPLTDADLLHGAYAAALAESHMDATR
jgi:hypothetical protein